MANYYSLTTKLPLSITQTQFYSFATPAITVNFPSAYNQIQIPFIFPNSASYAATKTLSTIGLIPATAGVTIGPTPGNGSFNKGGGGGGSNTSGSGTNNNNNNNGSTTSGNSKSLPVWEIAAIAAGGGVLLIGLTIGIYCWMTRESRRRRARGNVLTEKHDQGISSMSMEEVNGGRKNKLKNDPVRRKSRSGNKNQSGGGGHRTSFFGVVTPSELLPRIPQHQQEQQLQQSQPFNPNRHNNNPSTPPPQDSHNRNYSSHNHAYQLTQSLDQSLAQPIELRHRNYEDTGYDSSNSLDAPSMAGAYGTYGESASALNSPARLFNPSFEDNSPTSNRSIKQFNPRILNGASSPWNQHLQTDPNRYPNNNAAMIPPGLSGAPGVPQHYLQTQQSQSQLHQIHEIQKQRSQQFNMNNNEPSSGSRLPSQTPWAIDRSNNSSPIGSHRSNRGDIGNGIGVGSAYGGSAYGGSASAYDGIEDHQLQLQQPQYHQQQQDDRRSNSSRNEHRSESRNNQSFLVEDTRRSHSRQSAAPSGVGGERSESRNGSALGVGRKSQDERSRSDHHYPSQSQSQPQSQQARSDRSESRTGERDDRRSNTSRAESRGAGGGGGGYGGSNYGGSNYGGSQSEGVGGNELPRPPPRSPLRTAARQPQSQPLSQVQSRSRSTDRERERTPSRQSQSTNEPTVVVQGGGGPAHYFRPLNHQSSSQTLPESGSQSHQQFHLAQAQQALLLSQQQVLPSRQEGGNNRTSHYSLGLGEAFQERGVGAGGGGGGEGGRSESSAGHHSSEVGGGLMRGGRSRSRQQQNNSNNNNDVGES